MSAQKRVARRPHRSACTPAGAARISGTTRQTPTTGNIQLGCPGDPAIHVSAMAKMLSPKPETSCPLARSNTLRFRHS
jgi:hypothetical protein